MRWLWNLRWKTGKVGDARAVLARVFFNETGRAEYNGLEVKIARFAVMGGDRRMIAGLRARYMCACVAGFETYEGAPPSLLTFVAAATAADAVILPLPNAIGGNRNAPYTRKTHWIVCAALSRPICPYSFCWVGVWWGAKTL